MMHRSQDWIFVILLVGAAGLPVSADEQPTSPNLPEVTDFALPADQLGDEPAAPFDPLVPPPADAEVQRAARAWYMTGKVHEARGEIDPEELNRAIDAYRRAVELDPRAMRTYEALIPVLYTQNFKAEAQSLALQAARLDDQGLRIVRGLAAVLASGDSITDAVSFLRDAAAQDEFPADRLPGLLLHRDLGGYLHRIEQPVDAAQSYQLVFDALQDDEPPALSDSERQELLGDPGRTYDEIGKTFLEAKLPDLAVKAFDEAAKYRTSSPGVHSFNLALVFRETDRSEEALVELDKYFSAQLQSKGRDAYQLLKDLLSDLGRDDELLPKVEALYAEDQRNAFLAYFLADEYVARDKVEQAEELIEKTLGASDDPRGLVGLIPVYRQQRRSRELVKVLGKIFPKIPEQRSAEDLQKFPPQIRELVNRYDREVEALSKDSEALDGLMQVGRELASNEPPEITLPEAYMLGKLSIDAERTDDARHFYRLTMDRLNRPTLNVYRELGEFLIEQKQYTEAAEVFREAADKPAFEEARWILLYFMTYPLEFDGQTDEALTAIQEARGSQPDNPQLHFQEAWINYHAERWDEAESMLKEVIEDYKGQADHESIVRNSQFSLSNLYVQRGELERGEQVLEDVLKEAPDNSQANNDLGYLWADKNKNLDQARTMIEKALKEEPDNPAYLDSMGWVLFRLGEFAEARDYLEKAVAQPGGDDSTIYDHLGDVLDKLDLQTEAQAAWRKAVELERAKARPDDELLERVEAKLPAETPNADPPDAQTPSDDEPAPESKTEDS